MKTTIEPTYEINNPEELDKFLYGLIRDIRKGEVDLDMANSVCNAVEKNIKNRLAIVVEQQTLTKVEKNRRQINKLLMQKT